MAAGARPRAHSEASRAQSFTKVAHQASSKTYPPAAAAHERVSGLRLQRRYELAVFGLGTPLFTYLHTPDPDCADLILLAVSGNRPQRLGPAEYHAFKNDFFLDVAGPILATGGQIYQYVGDEVVVTWRVRGGRLARHPAETLLLLDDAIAERAERYRQRYGEVPRYKAGLHTGEVVTAEVGTIKKDLVHTGDAVNVAARVEGQCHAFGARLLVSEAALALAPLPASLTAEEVGSVELRGRAGAIRLFRLPPLSAPHTTATAPRDPSRRPTH